MEFRRNPAKCGHGCTEKGELGGEKREEGRNDAMQSAQEAMHTLQCRRSGMTGARLCPSAFICVHPQFRLPSPFLASLFSLLENKNFCEPNPFTLCLQHRRAKAKPFKPNFWLSRCRGTACRARCAGGRGGPPLQEVRARHGAAAYPPTGRVPELKSAPRPVVSRLRTRLNKAWKSLRVISVWSESRS